jgi:hypothetical protein
MHGTTNLKFINVAKPHSALGLYLADVTPYQLVIASHISTLDILLNFSGTSRDRTKYTSLLVTSSADREMFTRKLYRENCLTSCSDWKLWSSKVCRMNVFICLSISSTFCRIKCGIFFFFLQFSILCLSRVWFSQSRFFSSLIFVEKWRYVTPKLAERGKGIGVWEEG